MRCSNCGKFVGIFVFSNSWCVECNSKSYQMKELTLRNGL